MLPQRYQQTLDLTIPEGQAAFFKVSGTHAVYLTGNYVVPPDSGHDHDEDDSDYDMSPDEDELEGALDDDESDELDNLKDPRITEVESEEEEAPNPVKNEKKQPVAEKGRNKRAADFSDDEAVTLDAIMNKSLEPVEPAAPAEPKLSKKQLKKLKNNAGKAVEAAIENKDVKKEEASPAKGDKKVQFAKNLEQGPTGTTKEAKTESKAQTKEDAKGGKKEKAHENSKATLGPKTLLDGVKIDDKKLGRGRACKKGDKVGMRYIGKLESGMVFDGMFYESMNSPSAYLPSSQLTRAVHRSSSPSAVARSSKAGIAVSQACPSVASDVSSYPQSLPTAAKVLVLSRQTLSSPLTSSCSAYREVPADADTLVLHQLPTQPPHPQSVNCR